MPKGYKMYYFYVVHQVLNENSCDNILISSYFRTTREVAEFLNVSRPTIFKMIREGSKTILGKHFIIEKCNPPYRINDEDVIIS